MKKLILCCDGTWNSADQQKNEVLCPTNVVRMAYRIAKRNADMVQIVYYVQGVGTGNRLDRLVGGAFGKGVDDNIFKAYRFLIANYEPGDEIYLFGFSRGAFTSRSIAGMIRKCGILSREHIDRYTEAQALYQNEEHPDEEGPKEFRKNYTVNQDEPTAIRFIGVWDTVGALGIPVRGLRRLSYKKHRFHNTELSSSVKYAYHALAIDERRTPFKPTLWEYVPKLALDGGDQIVEQVWFPGVHSNIGGGYPDRSLADITLEWMIEKAKLAGLGFDGKVENIHTCTPDCNGKIYNSKKGIYRLSRGYDRTIGYSEKYFSDETSRNMGEDPTQSVHQSTLDRWDQDPGYRPPGLVDYFKKTKNERVKNL
jgi:uncharacterized protein (DUF2235 family)